MAKKTLWEQIQEIKNNMQNKNVSNIKNTVSNSINSVGNVINKIKENVSNNTNLVDDIRNKTQRTVTRMQRKTSEGFDNLAEKVSTFAEKQRAENRNKIANTTNTFLKKTGLSQNENVQKVTNAFNRIGQLEKQRRNQEAMKKLPRKATNTVDSKIGQAFKDKGLGAVYESAKDMKYVFDRSFKRTGDKLKGEVDKVKSSIKEKRNKVTRYKEQQAEYAKKFAETADMQYVSQMNLNEKIYQMGAEDEEQRKKIVYGQQNKKYADEVLEKGNLLGNITGLRSAYFDDRGTYVHALETINEWKESEAGSTIKNEIEEVENLLKDGNAYEAQEKLCYIYAREKNYYDDLEDEYNKKTGNTYFKGTDALNDGFQFSDIGKIAGATLGDAGTNILTGVASVPENLARFGVGGYAQVQDWIGNDAEAERLRKNISEDGIYTKKLKEVNNQFNDNSVFANKTDNVMQGVGTTGAMALGGYALAGAGLPSALTVSVKGHKLSMPILSVLSGTGGGLADAYAQGAEDWQAWLNAGGSGLVEGMSEGLFEFLGQGGSSIGSKIDDTIKNKLKTGMKSGVAQSLALMGLQAGEEGAEEVISYLGEIFTTNLIDKIKNTAGLEGIEMGKDFNWDEMMETFTSGFLSTLLTSAPGQVMNGLTNRANKNNVKNFIKDRQSLYEKRMQEIENIEKNEPQVHNNENPENTQKIDLPGLKNWAENSLNNIRNSLTEKLPQNQNMEQIEGQAQNAVENKVNLPQSSLEYYESAKKYNIDTNNKTVKNINNLFTKRGIKGSYNAEIFNNNSEVALWKQNEDGTREVIINPNADTNKTLNQVVMHEVTHDLVNSQSYKNMKESLFNFMNKDSEFMQAYETLTEKYLKQYEGRENVAELIEDEAIADIIGNKFGNQQFIDKIIKTDKNFAQKIYEHIKEAVQNIRAKFSKNYGEQLRFWQGIEQQWKQAFNEEYNISNDNQSKYHISSNFSNEIDSALENNLPSNQQIKARDFTPELLVKNGVPDLPMLITQKHIKSTIYSFAQAKQLGLPTKGVNYHGLGKELLIKAIDNLDSPESIYKANSNNYIVVTEVVNKDNDKIIVPIQINGKGSYNNIYIDENQIKSVYGKKKLDNYIKNNNFELIYKKNEELDFNQGIQYSKVANSSSNNIILHNTEKINKNEENQEKKLPSTNKARMALSENKARDNEGRELSKEQQEYFKDSKVRDKNGNLLTVYHGSNSRFTIFDLSKSGQASTESKVGFWFTESKAGAEKFAGETWYGNNSPTTYEVYLDLKNPKIYEPKNSRQDRLSLFKTTEKIKSEMREIKEKYEYADTTLQDVIRFNNYADAYGMTLEKFMEVKDVKKEKIPELVEAFNQYTKLKKQLNETEKILDNTGYDDSYEQFKTDLYSMVGQSASEANTGGIGMALNDYSAMKKLRNHLIEQGYDGIVIKNTKYDASAFGGNNNQYVAFDSNQIKNVDNTNPTSNPDIRYSKKDNKDKWQEYLDKKLPPKKEDTIKDIRLPGKVNVKKTNEVDKVAKEIKQEVKNEEKKKNYLTSKAQNYKRRIENTFKNNVVEKLETSKYINKDILNSAIETLENEYANTNDISEETINTVFDDLYANLRKVDSEYYNQYKDLKKEIRNTKLYVSDSVKGSITDYDDFKSNSRGRLSLTDESSNMQIDSYYKELSNRYPELFPNNIINPADQLQQISDITKDIAKVETNVQAYNDKVLGKDYKNWAKRDFEYEVDRMKKQLEIINKYSTEKNSKQSRILSDEVIDNMSLDEIKGLYEMRDNYQKQYEKVNNKELLTEKDKDIVERLLANKMTVDQILPGFNKEGIIKVFKSKQSLNMVNRELKEYKVRVKQKMDIVNEMLVTDVEKWKDKKIGKLYSRETAIRNVQDIMDKQSSKAVNDAIFKPVLKNESNRVRFINDKAQQIQDLEINAKKKYKYENQKVNEADLAGLYIEQKVTEEFLREQGADVNKIKKIANKFSEILNECIDSMEVEYLKYGYAPVHRRKNYFPHFTENKPDSILSKISSRLGIRTGAEALPTDIAGKTDTFKPGRVWNRNIQERKTDETDIDALKIMDMYINGASDVIYHTEDIQKLRSFERAIRNIYADKETKKRMLNIKEDDSLTLEEKQEAIEKIQEQIRNPLPNFVTWLNDYTNSLANKKSKNDRAMEQEWGRQAYTTMQDIEGKIASNMIGGNLSVSLTNISPLFQAVGTTKLGNVLTGMIETTVNSINDRFSRGDSFVQNSDFLTGRRGTEKIATQKFSQKLSDKLGIPMEMIDNFVSESIVRAKYRENLKTGMSEDEALKNADEYTANLMADRRKGALPTIFNSKNPIAKLGTMFQVEPNNMISNYTKDMKEMKTSKKVWSYAKLAVASHVFNAFLKEIRGGSDVLPDPIHLVSALVKYVTSDDDDEREKAGDEIITSILGSIPFGSSASMALTALGVDVEGLEDAGRFPVQSAIPSFQKLSKLFDKDVSKEYKKQVIEKELTKPLFYLGLPTGGAQISKTIQGVKALKEGGSYTYDEKGNRSLQFPIANTTGNVLKTTIFGKYSTDEGKKYLESFKGFNSKQTKVYDNTNVEFNRLKEYFDYSNQKGVSKEDKIDYINENMSDISTEDKWTIYEYNILSNTKKENGSTQLEEAKYIIENGVSKQEYMKTYEKLTDNDLTMIDKEDYLKLEDNNIGLSTYADYKVKIKNETSKLPKGKSLKYTQKCEILSSASYSNSEKKALFENYIAKEDDTYAKCKKAGLDYKDYMQYKIITQKAKKDSDKLKILYNSKISNKSIEKIYENCILSEKNKNLEYKTMKYAGIDIREYIKYKLQDFESNKKDDGTLYGKTISGSKKKKVLKYINSMNISYEQKLLLAGQQYSLTDGEKTKIYKYVNGLKISANEKKEILNKMKGFKVYKNGKVTW